MSDGTPSNNQPTWSAWDTCRQHWRAYAIAAATAIALAFIVSAGIPRTYSAQVKVSNENKETDLLIGLNNFASWAKSAMNDQKGLRLPEVYAHLVGGTDFADALSHVRIEGRSTDYYHYLRDNHRRSWWEQIGALFADSIGERERILALIHDNVRSKSSSKYGTIVIQATDQDPVVAALIADSACQLLQKQMADYAHDRAFRDLEQASAKADEALKRFEAARDAYNRFRDANNDIHSPRAASMEKHLQDEYAKAFDFYNKTMEQYRRAEALTGKTPQTFAVLRRATVPLEATGPATVGYVLAFLFIALVFTTWWVLLRRTLSEKALHSPWT